MTLKTILAIGGLFIPSLLWGQDNGIRPARLDSLVYRLGNNFIKDPKTVGLSIGIFTKGNRYFYDFGTTKVGHQQPPTPNTVYEIGSITKTFISFILAQAILEQKVSLQDDIRKYLKQAYPNLDYKSQPIRLVHLANTTSLLPDYLPELPLEMKNMRADSALAFKVNAYKQFTKRDFLTALHTVKLDTIPGFTRKHSNAAGQLLGYILEDIYGQSLDELLEKYITKPYGLNSTSFLSINTPQQLATGYTAAGKEAVHEFVTPYFKLAGGMGSSPADLVKYIQLLLTKSNGAAELSLQKTIDVSASTGEVVPLSAIGTANPSVYSVGLSWFSYQPEANKQQIWADGGTNGFNSYLALYPNQQSGVVILVNKSDEKIFRSLPGMAYEIANLLGQN